MTKWTRKITAGILGTALLAGAVVGIGTQNAAAESDNDFLKTDTTVPSVNLSIPLNDRFQFKMDLIVNIASGFLSSNLGREERETIHTDVVTSLANGQNLADITASKNKSAATLAKTIVDYYNFQIDRASTQRVISSDEAIQLKAKVVQQVTTALVTPGYQGS